jgi:dihydrofolate reductase
MRRIILWMSLSLDGFCEGPGREIDWSLVDDELHTHMNEELAQMSAFLEGRVTYELMAGVWPAAGADPAITGPMADFARIWLEMPKIVYSRTMGDDPGWNTTVFREVVPEEVRELKARPGGDMVVGGADLAATFMRHDLIDEYRLYIHPVAIGAGRRLFPADARLSLRLAETRSFGNGVVLLRYERP